MEILPAHHYQFSGLLTSVASLFLVILVYKKGLDRNLKIKFALYYFALFVWSFSLFICTSVYDYQVAYFFTQMTHAGAILIPVFFLHFTFAYLKHMSRPQQSLLWVLYAMAAFFMVINLFFRDLFFGSIVPKLSFPYFPNAGPFYTPWVVTFAIAVVIAHLVLFRAMIAAHGLRKQQIRFFLLSNALGYFGGIGCFFPVYNLPYLPFPYGPYGVLLLSLVSGYAILRYRFIDLQLLLKRTILFTALFALIIGTFSFMLFLFQHILSAHININPFLISAISAATIIFVYDRFREFLIKITDRYLFQKKQEIKAILKGLAKNVGDLLDPKQVGQVILSTLADAFRLESGLLVIYDWKNREYRIMESLGIISEVTAQGVKSYIGEPNFQQYLKGHPIISLDSPSSEDFPNYLPEWMALTKSRVCIFLSIDENQHGFLLLGKKKSDQQYTQDEIDYFPAIAGQAALAVRNALLVRTLVEEREAKVQAQSEARMVAYAKSIAHEIKNALAGLYGPAQFFTTYGVQDALDIYERAVKGQGQEVLEKKFMKFVDRMKAEGGKVFSKADEIRVISKTVEGTLASSEEEFEEFSFKVLWDSAIGNCRTESCQLIREIPDKFFPYGNIVLLQRVFVNLINNAVEAINGCQKNPEIVIRGNYAEVDHQPVALFELSNNGPGIPEGIQAHIFEQGFSTKPKPKFTDVDAAGHGQGLWVCKRIIEELHHGRLWVESRPGKGTSFKFWLPLKKEEPIRDVVV